MEASISTSITSPCAGISLASGHVARVFHVIAAAGTTLGARQPPFVVHSSAARTETLAERHPPIANQSAVALGNHLTGLSGCANQSPFARGSLLPGSYRFDATQLGFAAGTILRAGYSGCGLQSPTACANTLPGGQGNRNYIAHAAGNILDAGQASSGYQRNPARVSCFALVGGRRAKSLPLASPDTRGEIFRPSAGQQAPKTIRHLCRNRACSGFATKSIERGQTWK